MSLKVEDVMVKDVITIDAHASVREAAEKMNEYEIGCLIVTEKNRAVGILTERDLLKRVVVTARNPEKTKVKEVMSKPLIVTEPKTDLENAIKLMFDMKIKKLPVVKQGKLVGIVSLTDIARFQPHIIKVLKKLAATGAPPRRMQKVIHYYIA